MSSIECPWFHCHNCVHREQCKKMQKDKYSDLGWCREHEEDTSDWK